MTRRTQKLLLVSVGCAAAFTVLLTTMQGHSLEDLPAGTGYAAWDLCSRTMQSGEDFDHVRQRYVEPKVAPLPLIWNVDRQPGKSVVVGTMLSLAALERSAIYREKLGCTLIPPGTPEQEVRAQAFVPVSELAADGRPWPRGEGEVDRDVLGSEHREVIAQHAKVLFSELNADLKGQRSTTALLVARDGRLIYERYGQGYGRNQPQLGWSMTKTITAMVAGLMAEDGKLGLDEAVGMTQWKGTPKHAIKWRHLLNMAPGLDWFEGYGGASDATEMLFSQPNQGMWVAERPMTAKPGEVFTYSTGFSNLAMLRMRQLLGGSHQAIYDYYQSRLFAPLGIRGAVIEPDASGTPVGGARGMLRPVDWLRLGQLLADGGRRDDIQLLPVAHVAFMTTASPADAGYGGSIWLKDSHMIQAQVRKRLPDDLVWFAGFQGQFVVVVPSARLVVLRMGVAMADSMKSSVLRDQYFEMVADMVAAGPRSTP